MRCGGIDIDIAASVDPALTGRTGAAGNPAQRANIVADLGL